MLLIPMNTFAVDNPCLIRMNLQAAFPEPLREPFFDVLRLVKTTAMDESIIRIAAKRQPRKLRCHPTIEGVMQEEVREKR